MNLTNNILVILLVFRSTFSFSINSLSTKKGCNIFIKDKNPPRILYLKPTSPPKNYLFYWPNPDGNIKFIEKQNLNLQCPGSKVVAGGNVLDTSVTASCESDGKFSINGVPYEYKNIDCLQNIRHVAKLRKESCYQNLGDFIDIQFELKDRSLFQIEVCFDKVLGRTLYTCHLVPNIIKGGQSLPSEEKPRRFIQGIFYNEVEKNIKLDDLYYIYNQQKVINQLVGLPQDSKKYVDENEKKFLNRGHLAPSGDFVYKIQKKLTYYYINVAPQWEWINNGNWGTLEKNVRDYIANNYDNNIREFIIYTGTMGTATLPHEVSVNTMVKLYLHKGYGIPVPRYFVKYVYHPQTSKGILFFTVNNPYIKPEDVPSYIICKDISDSINWLTWKKNDIKLGVSFACDAKEANKIVPYLPRFKVTGLLPNVNNYSNYILTTNYEKLGNI